MKLPRGKFWWLNVDDGTLVNAQGKAHAEAIRDIAPDVVRAMLTRFSWDRMPKSVDTGWTRVEDNFSVVVLDLYGQLTRQRLVGLQAFVLQLAATGGELNAVILETSDMPLGLSPKSFYGEFLVDDFLAAKSFGQLQRVKTNPPSHTSLRRRLKSLRLAFAKAAQSALDEWEQDDEGFDEELGSGGICDRVAERLADVVAETLSDVEVTFAAPEGDDHQWIIAWNATEAYEVDIPPHVYETGGGYSWRKRRDAQIDADDIVIAPVDRKLVDELIEYR